MPVFKMKLIRTHTKCYRSFQGKGAVFMVCLAVWFRLVSYIIKYVYKSLGYIKLIKMILSVAFPIDLPLKYSAVVEAVSRLYLFYNFKI